MLNPPDFLALLKEQGIEFYTGVPDSTLKDICFCISSVAGKGNHVTAANEGGAIALAAGHYLATGNPGLVYMQNSGIGNAVNPLLSLADPEVYSIPMLLLIGWRGGPGTKDEPQHIKQGKVTLPLLESMGIEYAILPDSIEAATIAVREACRKMSRESCPVAIIVQRGAFGKYEHEDHIDRTWSDAVLTREEAIEIVIDCLSVDDIIVSTTGKASRELYELREKSGAGHARDFLTVGSMGHASMIALGIALEESERRVICLDGDGAALMHMGALAVIGGLRPENFIHIVLNNGCYDSVGGQPTECGDILLTGVSEECGYALAEYVSADYELRDSLTKALRMRGPSMIEVNVKRGSRANLGRPDMTPVENKTALMNFLKEDKSNKGER